MIATLRAALVAIPATIWYGTRILWNVRKGGERARCACEELPRTWAQVLCRGAGVRVELEGEEIIDPDRPQVLVANHVSWFDVLALAAYIPGKYRFVAKKELASIPFFGPSWVACGHIGIDRSDRASAIRSLEEARMKLERDRPTVILFPEGTRSKDGRLLPFKKGAFVLALQTGVEVIPAAITGSREIMGKGSFRIRPGTVRIRFGRPLDTEGLDVEDRGVLTQRARAAVSGLLGAPEVVRPDGGAPAPPEPSTNEER